MEKVTTWFKNRFGEVTTWDGVTICAVSGLALVSSPFIEYVAIAGLAFGIFRVVKSERNKS